MQPDPLFTDEEQPLASIAGEDEDDSTPAPEVPATAPEFPTFKRAVELIRTKTRLNAELKAADDELKRLQPLVSSYFAQHTLPRITTDHMTLYIRRELWARAKTGKQLEVCAALRRTGLGHFVHDSFSVSSLSAHIRELERKHAKEIDSGAVEDVSAYLPAEVAKVLNVNPSFKLLGRNTEKES